MPFCGNAQFETIAYTSYMFHCTRSWSWSTANKWSLVENSKPQIRFLGCFKGQNWQIPCVHPDFRSWNLSWWPLRDELNMKIDKQIHDAPSKTLGSANGKIESQKEIQVEDFRDIQLLSFSQSLQSSQRTNRSYVLECLIYLWFLSCLSTFVSFSYILATLRLKNGRKNIMARPKKTDKQKSTLVD